MPIGSLLQDEMQRQRSRLFRPGSYSRFGSVWSAYGYQNSGVSGTLGSWQVGGGDWGSDTPFPETYDWRTGELINPLGEFSISGVSVTPQRPFDIENPRPGEFGIFHAGLPGGDAGIRNQSVWTTLGNTFSALVDEANSNPVIVILSLPRPNSFNPLIGPGGRLTPNNYPMFGARRGFGNTVPGASWRVGHNPSMASMTRASMAGLDLSAPAVFPYPANATSPTNSPLAGPEGIARAARMAAFRNSMAAGSAELNAEIGADALLANLANVPRWAANRAATANAMAMGTVDPNSASLLAGQGYLPYMRTFPINPLYTASPTGGKLFGRPGGSSLPFGPTPSPLPDGDPDPIWDSVWAGSGGGFDGENEADDSEGGAAATAAAAASASASNDFDTGR